MRLSFKSLATWAAVSLAAPSCIATTSLTDGYAVRVWQADDGLPQNMVTAAVQTRDGYLWFGTYSGLARFNGERFQVFDSVNTPAILDRRITYLFEDRRGTLWIGTDSGTVTRYSNGTFTLHAPASGAVGEKIIGLGTDENDRLWGMRGNGSVAPLDGGDPVTSLIAPALPNVMAWTRNAAGNIWVTENGLAARLLDGSFAPLAFPPPRTENYVLGIAASADGGVWVLCDNQVRKWKGDRWVEDRGAFPWPPGSLACALELHDGTLAVGTIYSGVYLIFGDGRPPVSFDRSKGMPQNWGRFLFEDREHNLWVGAGSAGLVSIHRSAFSVLNPPDQWQGCTVLSAAPGQGNSLWIGTDGAGLYHFRDGQWSHYGEAEGLPNRYIPAVVETEHGEVWAGHFWWGSPFRLEDGRFARPSHVDEKSAPVFGLLTTPGSDDLLVGNRDGLLQLTGDQAAWLVKAPHSSAGAVCAMVREPNGTIWCGFGEGGLARLAGNQLSVFRRKDGLPTDSVQCLFLDDDGSLWIGTADGGLSRYRDGRFANLGIEHGLADSFVGAILDDGLGYLWLSTHHGLQRISKSELKRCANGESSTVTSHIYNSSDGLPTIDFTGGLQGAGCKSRDGRLWFASSKGLVSVDPSQIVPNPVTAPVVLESFLVDGGAVRMEQDVVENRLQPDHERLEFGYTGLSFVAPGKVLFKYRLEGIDKAWVDAGTKRTAYYSRLPAGTYRFHVIACNNDGLWNTRSASVQFSVAPFFWQTWWFVGTCALAALSGVAAMVRFITRRRMQRRMQNLQRQHALERERARIAQDIHDDVGSSLARIAMLSQPARGDLAEPQRTAAVLARIYATAREVTRALDEIVWAVDPHHDTLDSLVSYMGKFAQDFLAAADIRCRLDAPVDLPNWRITAETRHNLFLAFKEGLNNVLKHAAATEVRVSLTLRTDSFVLTIKDNGRGIDPQRSGTSDPGRLISGHGLQNMQRRLSLVGGRCEIFNGPDQGTTVSFHVGLHPHDPSPSPPLRASAPDPSRHQAT